MYSSGAKSLSSQIRRTTLRLERDVCALEKRLVAVSHHPGRPEVLGQRSFYRPVFATPEQPSSRAALNKKVSTLDYAQESCVDSPVNHGLLCPILTLTNALSNCRPKISPKSVYLLKQRRKQRYKVLTQNLQSRYLEVLPLFRPDSKILPVA